jgi:nucleoside-diphosphate-sugar epimerase
VDSGLDSKSSLFITGGTGYLGSLLLRRLKETASVTVLTRDPEGFRSRRPELIWPDLNFLKGDIETFEFPEESSFEYVIHGGNPADLPSDPEGQAAFRRTAQGGTAHLIKQIDRLPHLPKRILLLSSGAVYGPQPPELDRSDEKRKPTPGDIYGESKYETELLLAEFARARGIGAGIARIFACAGPYLPLTGRFALGQFISQARDSGEIRILSDGTPKRSYLDGDELAEWLLALLHGRPGVEKEIETFNVGSDDAITIAGLAEIVSDVFKGQGKTISLSLGATDPRRPASPSYLPDIRLIAEKYGLKPKKSSTQAVRDATEWALHET